MSFLVPKTKVPPAPTPPVIEDTQATQQQTADQLMRRRGRAANILNNNPSTPVTAGKYLLGS